MAKLRKRGDDRTWGIGTVLAGQTNGLPRVLVVSSLAKGILSDSPLSALWRNPVAPRSSNYPRRGCREVPQGA
jgi:hypothetical protein